MFFFSSLSFFFWPLVFIVIIVLATRRVKKSEHVQTEEEKYLSLELSQKETVSQLFLFLSTVFLGSTLAAFNRGLSNPFSFEIILVTTSIISFLIAYYFKAVYSLIWGIVGLVVWWGIHSGHWIQLQNITASTLFVEFIFIALIFSIGGRLHQSGIKFKRFGYIYSVLGTFSIIGALFIFSTKYGLVIIQSMTRGVLFVNSWQITVSLLILSLILIVMALYAVAKKLISYVEFIRVLVLMLLFGALLLPEQVMVYSYGAQELSSTGIMWSIIFNVAIFFELTGIIYSGYLRKETWLINLGTFFLALLIIVKYFDWSFTFLDKSIFFIGAGVLLFAVGWFMEKGRRMMISNIKT